MVSEPDTGTQRGVGIGHCEIYPESLRDHLPSGETYPLRRTTLDRALEAAGVESIDTVYFLRSGVTELRQSGRGEVMRVDFRTGTDLLPERIEIRIHAVPVELARVVRDALTRQVVDRAARWIRDAETAGNTWRSTDHAFVTTWERDRMRVTEM